MRDQKSKITSPLEAYYNRTSGKLTCWWWRHYYHASYPRIAPLLCAKYYQFIDGFISTRGFTISADSQSVRRNNNKEDMFAPVIIFGQQCVELCRLQNTVTSWRIQVVSSFYGYGTFIGLIEHQLHQHDYHWLMDYSHFIAINELGQPQLNGKYKHTSLTVYKRWCTTDLNKNNIQIQIKLNTGTNPYYVEFWIENVLTFKAQIRDDGKYKLCMSFEKTGGEAILLGFNQQDIHTVLHDYDWDHFFHNLE